MAYSFANQHSLMFQAIKRLLLVFAGVLGGAVVAGILSLLLLHLKVAFALGEVFFGINVLLIFLVCIGAGMIAPRFFMMFFLCPISWLMDSDSTGGGHPSGGSDVDWPNFLSSVSYMVGLVLFVSGVAFSLSWIVGFGLLGVTVFTIGVFRNTKKQGRVRRPS
jgi:hypothetical protein